MQGDSATVSLRPARPFGRLCKQATQPAEPDGAGASRIAGPARIRQDPDPAPAVPGRTGYGFDRNGVLKALFSDSLHNSAKSAVAVPGSFTMRRSLAVAGLLASILTGGLLFAMLPTAPTEAASADSTFIVPGNDGYGIGECVSSGSACGRVVADAWCEAQGFGRSQSFGVADPAEMTGSINTRAASRPISITCAR